MLNKLIYIFQFPFYLLSCLIPRNKNYWIIGDRFGERYDDNSKFLFEYISNLDTKIKIIWITNRNDIKSNLEAKGFYCYTKWSFYGMYYSLISKIAIVTFSRYDINSFLMGNATWINLHHGNTIKADGTYVSLKSKIIHFLIKIFLRYRSSVYDYMVCTNNNKTLFKQFNEDFNIKKSNFLVSGLPRNDFFYKNNSLKKQTNLKRKTVLYAPTFRIKYIYKEYDLFYKYGWDLKKIESFINKQNIKLIIKAHPNLIIPNSFILETNNSKNIELLFDSKTPVQEILYKTDILITDYSGIYIDFLHLKRPVIMAPFDKSYFFKNEGLSYDYKKVTPGISINNWEAFMKIRFDDLSYDQKHQKVFDFFDLYQDGNNSKRVYENILKSCI